MDNNDVDFIADYKRNGYFDNNRKQLLKNFTPMEEEITPLIKELVLIMVQKDPSIVTKNNNKLGAMIQKLLIQPSQPTQPAAMRSIDSNSDDQLLNQESEIVKKIKTIIDNYVQGEVVTNEALLQSILNQLAV